MLADLGRAEKQEAFFANMPYPDLETLAGNISLLPSDEIRELSKLFLMEREKAQLEQQLADYRLEYEHFSRYRQSQNYNDMETLSVSKLPSKKIVQFLAETQLNVLQNKKASFFYRLKLFIKFSFKEFSLLSQNEIELVLEVQSYYYQAKISEISRQIEELKLQLLRSNFEERQKSYQEASREILNYNLAKRYTEPDDATFTKESFKKDFDRFLAHYPVILSTTLII